MKTNLLLFVALVVCALGLVTSQHYARKNFVALEQAHAKARQLETAWDQLQLEQSSLSSHNLVDKVAKRDLKMQAVQPSRTLYVAVPDSTERPVARDPSNPTAIALRGAR
jgi:cell division protein FtsL